MKKNLLQYVDYNLWANKRIADVLLKQDASFFDKEVKNSFPSIRKTTNHILDAEVVWLYRLQHKIIAWPPGQQLFPNANIDQFAKYSEEFLKFISAQNESFFITSTTFKDSKGTEYTMSNDGIIMHCMNHSTFHRGQIVTMLRQLGVTEIVSTDLITYLRLK